MASHLLKSAQACRYLCVVELVLSPHSNCPLLLSVSDIKCESSRTLRECTSMWRQFASSNSRLVHVSYGAHIEWHRNFAHRALQMPQVRAFGRTRLTQTVRRSLASSEGAWTNAQTDARTKHSRHSRRRRRRCCWCQLDSSNSCRQSQIPYTSLQQISSVIVDIVIIIILFFIIIIIIISYRSQSSLTQTHCFKSYNALNSLRQIDK